MPFTNYGTQATVWAIGSNPANNYIQYFAIGSGSGIAAITDSTLFAESGVRVGMTGSPNFNTARKVTFAGDYNSVQMRGLQFSEFGLFASGGANTGSAWTHDAFTAITFDGTNELSLQYSVEVIPG